MSLTRWVLPIGSILTLGVLAACAGPAAAENGDGPRPLDAETYQRVLAQGVDPAAVHVIDLAGFDLQEQSAGVVGDDEYGAIYTRGNTVAYFQVAGNVFDESTCAAGALWLPTGDSYDVETCEPDDAGWYRTAGSHHEYVVQRGDYVLNVVAPLDAATRDDLSAALLGAIPQEDAASAPSSSKPSAPAPESTDLPLMERGDLPPAGDGAPMNDVGQGG